MIVFIFIYLTQRYQGQRWVISKQCTWCGSEINVVGVIKKNMDNRTYCTMLYCNHVMLIFSFLGYTYVRYGLSILCGCFYRRTQSSSSLSVFNSALVFFKGSGPRLFIYKSNYNVFYNFWIIKKYNYNFHFPHSFADFSDL